LPGVRETLTHFSTWSMIFNPTLGKYGIQLKNPKKDDKISAGKWDMGVAGHNCYVAKNRSYTYLDFDENLVKEAAEEIGIRLTMCDSQKDFVRKVKNNSKEALGFIFEKFHYKTPTDNEWVGIGFVILSSKNVSFTDDEVVDFQWLTPDELRTFLTKNSNYCSPLPLVFEKAEKFRIANFS